MNNISGFKIPQFKLPQQMATAGASQQQPKGATPDFGGMAGGIKGNLLSPAVGGPASPMGNRLNLNA